MSVIANLISQQSPEFSVTEKGGRRNLVYLVTGLNPNADPLVEALLASSGVPQYGSGYPFFGGLGMTASSLKALPFKDARDKAYAVVTFTTPQRSNSNNGLQVKISGTTVQVPWEKDPQTGDPLLVGYKDPATGQNLYDQVKLSVPQPHCVLEFTRQEIGSPLAKSQQYTGSVNSDSWQGGKKLTWMCREISGEWLGKQLFSVTYRFEYDPDDWTEIYIFRDPITGRIPNNTSPDPRAAHGQYLYTPPKKAFAALGLPNAF